MPIRLGRIHLPLVAFACLATMAMGQTAPEPAKGCFADEPADALIGRLDKVEQDARPVVADSPAGLQVTRRHHWDTGLNAVVLQTTLTNADQQPIALTCSTPAQWTFRLRNAQDAGYEKLTYRSDVWYGSTYWTGPDWTRVGKNWHHPGQNTSAVRRFTAPSDGKLSITGRVYKLHAVPSDGVRLSILHRDRVVWQAEIDGTDEKGVEPNLELDVRAGDAIRFVVHKQGEIFCDTTHWDPLITYADGRRYQASEGFSTKTQGENGWSYEMPRDGSVPAGLPRAYTLTNDLALREVPLAAGQSTRIDAAGDLPLVLVADGADRSGVVATLDSAGPWSCQLELVGDEQLHLRWTTEAALTIAPGQSLELPAVVLSAYRGESLSGLATVARFAQSDQLPSGATAGLPSSAEDTVGQANRGTQPVKTACAQLREQLAASLSRLAAATAGPAPELDLWLLAQAEWRREDKLQETAESYAAATNVHLEKAQKLLANLQVNQGQGFLAKEADQLKQLAEQAKAAEPSLEAQRRLYQSVRTLKRRIALANPLMDFDRLVFCKRVPTSYSHLVMQYYGWRARPGGGLFVLERPGYSLHCQDILGNQLGSGNVLEPRLSYDAKWIVFSFVSTTGQDRDPLKVTNDLDDGFYHVYTMNVDGTGLKQLTEGLYDDVMPTWLPDGGIAFCSTRRQGYARCFGPQFSPRWDVYTLHRMEADGSNLRTLSFHDTNEWFPTVSNTGHILYSRWDYIDRDAVTHQTLWASRPDGTNPVAVWGNATPSPHCTFQIQPIPNSTKIIFTAAAHHSITAGPITIVDPSVRNDGHEALTRITPEIPFPEAESMDIREYYDAPWPLSEDYYLVSYSRKPLVWEPGANDANALGVYLLDRFGNREILYRDPQIGSTNACPLVPRPTPPALPNELPPNAPPQGEMVLADVYQGLGDCPRGSIKQLRIVQIFPKTTPIAGNPPIGAAAEENARAILGTVPVEPDGSARFIVPARKPLLFQALDEDGLAYQTMRTITYLQPGERITCVGCHENRMSAPVAKDILALRRRPSEIEPGELGGRPFSYVSVVQPVLDRHCVSCHGGEKVEGKMDLTGVPHQGFTRSYVSLCDDYNFWGAGTNPENAAHALVPRFGARNQLQATPPGGMYGARGSRLMKLLRDGHHDVQLTPDELRRLAAWIDLNATFYGDNLPENQAKQLRGEELAMPAIQ